MPETTEAEPSSLTILSADAKTTSQIGRDRIVPLGQNLVRLQAKRLELFGCRFSAGGIVAAVEVSGDRQAGLSSGGADEVQDFLVAVEWFAGPAFGDLGKETVFDGVPLGSASRVVGNGESQTERIG